MKALKLAAQLRREEWNERKLPEYGFNSLSTCRHFNSHVSETLDRFVSTEWGFVPLSPTIRRVSHRHDLSSFINQSGIFKSKHPPKLEVGDVNANTPWSNAPTIKRESSTVEEQPSSSFWPNTVKPETSTVQPSSLWPQAPMVKPETSTVQPSSLWPQAPMVKPETSNQERAANVSDGPMFPPNLSNGNPRDIDISCTKDQIKERSKFVLNKIWDHLPLDKYQTPKAVQEKMLALQMEINRLADEERIIPVGETRLIFKMLITCMGNRRQLIMDTGMGDLKGLCKTYYEEIFQSERSPKKINRLLEFFIMAGCIIDYNYQYLIRDSCLHMKRLYVMDDIVTAMVKNPLVPMFMQFKSESTRTIMDCVNNYYEIFYNYLAPVAVDSTFMTKNDDPAYPPKSRERYEFRLTTMAKYLTLLFIEWMRVEGDTPFGKQMKVFYAKGKVLDDASVKVQLRNPGLITAEIIKRVPFDRLLQLILMRAFRCISGFNKELLDCESDDQYYEAVKDWINEDCALPQMGVAVGSWNESMRKKCCKLLLKIYKSVAQESIIERHEHRSHIEFLANVVEDGIIRVKQQSSAESMSNFYKREDLFGQVINCDLLMLNTKQKRETFREWASGFFNNARAFSFDKSAVYYLQDIANKPVDIKRYRVNDIPILSRSRT